MCPVSTANGTSVAPRCRRLLLPTGDCESGDRQRQRSEAGSEHPTLCLGKTPGQDGLAALLLSSVAGREISDKAGYRSLGRSRLGSSASGEREGHGDARPGTRFHLRRRTTNSVPWPVVSGTSCASVPCAARNRASSPGEGSVSALRVLLSGCALAD